MTSIVGISNLALSHTGSRSTIQSMDEGSTESDACRLHFAAARDAVLRAHDWNFARVYETLALRSETPPDGWGYLYSQPNLCVRFRGIWAGRPITPPIKFQPMAVRDAGSNLVRVIATDQQQAVGWFTASVVDPELFDALFVQALAWRLAAEIALPLTQKDSVWKNCETKAAAVLAEAMTQDANEGQPVAEEHVPEAISVRG